MTMMMIFLCNGHWIPYDGLENHHKKVIKRIEKKVITLNRKKMYNSCQHKCDPHTRRKTFVNSILNIK